MRRRLRLRSALLPLLLAGTALGARAEVRVSIDSPRPGQQVQNRVDQAPIRGAASADAQRASEFDVMLVLDVSHSTRCASGVDVDGDGEVCVDPRLELLPGSYPEDACNTDPDDSILHAEAAAARALVASLDPRRSRLGLVTFAGEVDPMTRERRSVHQQDAWLHVPLTSDLGSVLNAVDAVVARGPAGATNFAAGVRLAVTELSGLPGARSSRRAGAQPVILFLTDGVPSFPIGSGLVTDPGDVEAAISAAKLAQLAGIRINTYALGAQALSYPQATTEMARVSLGTYTPVQNPGDIVALLQGVSFANVEDVVIANLTTGDFSTDVQLKPDGSFSGFVPVREGRNQVRVTALASDGTRGSATLDLDFGRTQLTDLELARELERIRRMNKELLLLKERKKIEDFRSRERKDLELEVERSP
ncbi:MAG TPA: vWA domain-containing protein [Myxococcota bacterium]|nr:vWA domain-containing protein [Myxococcota bacterium]